MVEAPSEGAPATKPHDEPLWPSDAEAERASARRYSDLGDRLGVAWRRAQQEAYEGYERAYHNVNAAENDST